MCGYIVSVWLFCLTYPLFDIKTDWYVWFVFKNGGFGTSFGLFRHFFYDINRRYIYSYSQ
ncbi:hypothetical protein MIDIC_240032 [Alphaproteobacteria bacterium]